MDPATMLLGAKAAMGLLVANSSRKFQTEALRRQSNVARQLIGAGAALERAELDLRMEEELTASMEQAAASSEALNEVLASQKALFASRGQKSDAGTALAIKNKSIQNYLADERSRELGLQFKKYNIENKKQVSKLNEVGALFNVDTNRFKTQSDINDAFYEKVNETAGPFAGKYISEQVNNWFPDKGVDLGKGKKKNG